MAVAPEREVDETRDERLAQFVDINRADEGNIELRESRTKLEDVTQAGEAGTRIVDCQFGIRAEVSHRGAKRLVVGDLRVLGHLEHHPPSGASQERPKRLPRQDERRRRIEAEPCGPRQYLGRQQRSPQGGCLELGAEADGRCVGEAAVGADTVLKAGEG
ncbi:MAG: hypothetical protein ABI978_00275, partial [Chloroflexota bacterium]